MKSFKEFFVEGKAELFAKEQKSNEDMNKQHEFVKQELSKHGIPVQAIKSQFQAKHNVHVHVDNVTAANNHIKHLGLDTKYRATKEYGQLGSSPSIKHADSNWTGD